MIQRRSFDNCVRQHDIEISNLFDLELQLVNLKPKVKNKLKDLIGELKNLKFKTVLILEHNKKDNHK